MSDDMDLCRSFLAQAGPGVGPSAELEQLLRDGWQAGRDAWPGIEVPAADFARHLGRHMPGKDPRGELARIHAADLYLACGCALGRPEALAAFERAFLAQVPALLGHMNVQPADADEVGQRVRARLFIASAGEEPKIVSYSGGGSLGSWLRAVVVRTALNLRRERRPQAHLDDEVLAALPFSEHPEIQYVKERHREDVLRALRDAFASLPREQRNALRLQYAGGLSGDRIAGLLGKSRATVVRWLASAREGMLREMRRLLQERLGLRTSELDSFVEMVRSRLDMSITALLHDSDE